MCTVNSSDESQSAKAGRQSRQVFHVSQSVGIPPLMPVMKDGFTPRPDFDRFEQIKTRSP